MKTAMTIIGVILLLSTIALIFTGCAIASTSVASPAAAPMPSAPAVRVLSDGPSTGSGQVNAGFTGSVNLTWQWPTNCNTAAFSSAYVIIQATTNINPGLSLSNGWHTLATIPYTAAPTFSFNVTNSVQQFFRWRITVPGLY